MRNRKLLGLLGANLRRDLRSALVSVVGVGLGCGSLVFFLALGEGLANAVSAVFPAQARELEATLPQVALGGLFGEQKLDDALAARLAAIPGVERAFPKMTLRIPAVTRYQGLFFGKDLRMALEVMGVGVPPELMQGDLTLPFADVDDLTKPLPVLVNKRLLEIYNKIFAPQRGLPRLTEAMITGFTFPVDLGRSWVAARSMPQPLVTSLKLVGFSDRATLAGITLPLDLVRRIHRHFGQDADTYSSVLLRVRTSGEVPLVAARVKELGLEIDESERGRAVQIGAAVRVTALALALLSALISALAGINVAQAFAARVRERRREIGVLRAVGATRSDVRWLFLLEALAIGIAGGLLGVLSARLLALSCDFLARTRLPDFPFKPAHFFAFEGWMLGAGLLLALGASLLGAWVPARAAAATDPARALAEG